MKGKQKPVHSREASIWKKKMNIWRKGTARHELCPCLLFIAFEPEGGSQFVIRTYVEIQSHWVDKPEDGVQDKHACWRIRGEPWQ